MLVEILLATSCSIDSAALGVCECGSERYEGSFQVCATERIVGREDVASNQPGSSSAKPLRQCSWYVNGSIDRPTLGIITAWIPVGSRPCIGDAPARQAIQSKSVEQEVSDIFGANPRQPKASWNPGGEIEIGVSAQFSVELAAGEFTGTLLGRQARIRFQPIAAEWQFSDGVSREGFEIERNFATEGSVGAIARVRVMASYRFDGGAWQRSDAEIWLRSNQLAISVIEIPRRTLLVIG